VQTTAEPGGTTTVAAGAGGGGLLLLIQPASKAAGASKTSQRSMRKTFLKLPLYVAAAPNSADQKWTGER
jgi:hypothetical protein